MTLIGNIDLILVKMMIESQKNTSFEQKFRKKISFKVVTLTNTFYGCLFKTSNQIENGTIDFLFKMHMGHISQSAY